MLFRSFVTGPVEEVEEGEHALFVLVGGDGGIAEVRAKVPHDVIRRMLTPGMWNWSFTDTQGVSYELNGHNIIGIARWHIKPDDNFDLNNVPFFINGR